jgi:hypothetical protein
MELKAAARRGSKTFGAMRLRPNRKGEGKPMNLEQLATAARPINLKDWGSPCQIDAQNDFLDALAVACAGRLTVAETAIFDTFCHRASPNEMIDEGLRLARLAATR